MRTTDSLWSALAGSISVLVLIIWALAGTTAQLKQVQHECDSLKTVIEVYKDFKQKRLRADSTEWAMIESLRAHSKASEQ